MERKICKKCGESIYFDSDYCLDCAEDIELERLSNLTESEFENEYSVIIDDLLTNRKFTSDSINSVKRLMMINEKINPNLQSLCARLGLADIPEIYYETNEKVIDDLSNIKNAQNPTDWGLEMGYDVATGKADWLNICDKNCYELIPDKINLDEDVYSIIKLRIEDVDGKVYQINDLFKCVDVDIPDEERVETNIVVTFRVGKKVSPFLPRFNDRSSTIGGYLCEDFDSEYDECEKCDEGMQYFAQITAKHFGFSEGCFQLSKCPNCGHIQVRYEQT